jgi:hypothetical protein
MVREPQDISPAVEEIQRLCEVIVGLRATIAAQAAELERLRSELRRVKGYPENPCTGAEFVAAMQAAIEPRSDEEILDIIAAQAVDLERLRSASVPWLESCSQPNEVHLREVLASVFAAQPSGGGEDR